MSLTTAPLLTDHMVDDLPPQYKAIDQFCTFSSFSFLNCEIADDCRTIRYKLSPRADHAKRLWMANLTILVLRLPLTVEHDIFQLDGVVIESTLIIRYTGI